MSTFRARLERAAAPGYSSCGACGRPWKFAKGHTTNYTETRGCFPLCESCWVERTPKQRLPYYADLIYRWLEEPMRHDPADLVRILDQWPEIRDAVMEGK